MAVYQRRGERLWVRYGEHTRRFPLSDGHLDLDLIADAWKLDPRGVCVGPDVLLYRDGRSVDDISEIRSLAAETGSGDGLSRATPLLLETVAAETSPEVIFGAWVERRKDFFQRDFELPLSDDFGGRLTSKVKLPCIGKRPCLLLHDLEPGVTKYQELRERIQAAGYDKHLFPVLGVSGCGKTRLAYELLVHSFGFYLVGDVDKNGGSSDIQAVQMATQYGSDPIENTNSAELAMLAVVLARLMIFQQCRKDITSFTPRRWLIMQTYFKEFVGYDPFTELSLELRTCSREAIRSAIHKLWVDEAIWLLDEAQVLGTGDMIFQSFKTTNRSHVFSPILRILLSPCTRTAYQKHIVLILGTGLSFLRLEDSVVSKLAWFTSDMTRDKLFICDLHSRWSEDTIQEYVLSLLEVDAAVIKEMCRWLVGRRRPVATVVELLLQSDELLPGAMLAEFVRVCTQEDVAGSFYASIKDLYGGHRQGNFFLRGGQLVDFPEVLRTVATFVLTVGDGDIVGAESNDLLLVEYGLGNVTRLERNKLVFTIDEPLVKAAMYFAWDKGLVAHRLKSNMVPTMDVPSIGGRIWEKLACFDLEEYFKTRPTVEDCPCFQGCEMPKAWRGEPMELAGNGLGFLATESNVDVQEFIKSGGWKFYSFDDRSGPDIMFFLIIGGRPVPVFCQFKLRKRLSAAEADAAVLTTQACKMYRRDEQKQKMLVDICRDGYISLVITFPVTVHPLKQQRKKKGAAQKRRLIGYVQEEHMQAMFAGSYEFLCAIKGVEVGPGKRPRLV